MASRSKGSGALTDGVLEEFTAAFGGHPVLCLQLANGPVSFKAREHLRCFIP